MNYSTEVKKKLLSIIEEMDSYHWLFTKNPETDFSRKKKWSFEEIIKFMLTIQGKSLRDKLLDILILTISHHLIQHSTNAEHRYCQKHLNSYFRNLPILLVKILHTKDLD